MRLLNHYGKDSREEISRSKKGEFMAAKVMPSGNYGYKTIGQITLPLAGTQATVAITPADSDLHDISKEGILVTHVVLTHISGVAASMNHLALFNRTSNNDPKTNYTQANWKTIIYANATGAAYGFRADSQPLDLSSLPGGGVPLIADFITLTGKLQAAGASDSIIEYALYYQWIPINSDDYRTLLYARSI